MCAHAKMAFHSIFTSRNYKDRNTGSAFMIILATTFRATARNLKRPEKLVNMMFQVHRTDQRLLKFFITAA